MASVRYHDAGDPTIADDDLLRFVHEERLPLPVTFLNGRLLCTGKIDPLQIVIIVAQEHERLLALNPSADQARKHLDLLTDGSSPR